MRALIIIDVQQDFVPGGALAVTQGDHVIPTINTLQQKFDLIVATEDWHPRDHASFAANHPGKKPGDVIEIDGLQQVLWPVHCVQNTPGADFARGLETQRFAHVTRKGTDPKIDSYSAFFDNGHRKATDLADYLKSKSVTDVYLCGLATDYCVKFTALDARQLGLRVYLVNDAVKAVELKPGDAEAAVDAMGRAGVSMLTSDEVVVER